MSTITVTSSLSPAIATREMLRDVIAGLNSRPKILPSRYLYDRRGAQLFERICDLPEYYIPRVEIAILLSAMPEISEWVGRRARILEPGSGAGVKTRLLLDGLSAPASYLPIDLSREQLTVNAILLGRQFPKLEIRPLSSDFTQEFSLPPLTTPAQKTIAFFPGSTIGNLSPEEATQLLRRFARHVGRDGAVLIGIDLQKDSDILEAAYNDAQGVSAEFALNYLNRLNRELGANFDSRRFGYDAFYNERLGRVEMYIVSLAQQTVYIDDHAIPLREGEHIQTEVAYKYTLDAFAAQAGLAGLTVERVWTDPRDYFAVLLLVPHQAKGMWWHSASR